MEITLSYRQLAAIGLVVGVIAVGIGVVKVGELTGESESFLPFEQSEQVTNVKDMPAQNQQSSLTTEQLVTITSEIKDLRNDLDAIKSKSAADTTNTKELNDIASAQARIAALEKKVKELSSVSTVEAEKNHTAKEVEELYAMLSTLESKMNKLETQINALKEQLESESAKQQDDDVVVQPSTPETEESPGEQSQETKVKSLTASTNRVEYVVEETIMISGKTDPSMPVKVQIINEKKTAVFSTTVNADAAGVFRVAYEIPSDFEKGWYNVEVRSGDKSSLLVVRIIGVDTLTAKSESGILTISVASNTYSRGEYISVSGDAPPRSKVVLTITPTSGNEASATVWSDSDGKYQKLFQLTIDASSGDWILSAKYNGETASLKVKVL